MSFPSPFPPKSSLTTRSFLTSTPSHVPMSPILVSQPVPFVAWTKAHSAARSSEPSSQARGAGRKAGVHRKIVWTCRTKVKSNVHPEPDYLKALSGLHLPSRFFYWSTSSHQTQRVLPFYFDHDCYDACPNAMPTTTVCARSISSSTQTQRTLTCYLDHDFCNAFSKSAMPAAVWA